MLKMITLKTAEEFHGHLGPWLVLGLLMGDYGLKKIRAEKYFGCQIKVSGLNKKPRSCLIDGLQLSTGCTLGKGNIHIKGDGKIRVTFINRKNNKHLSLSIKDNFIREISREMSHKEAELLAASLYKVSPLKLFNPIKT